MNILNTLKGWFDSEILHKHPSQNSSSDQGGSVHAASSAFAHHSNAHPNNTHSLISKSGLDSLLASVKNTVHQQSEQLTTAATDMGKKLTRESNEAISSVFSSVKSALAKQTSRLKNPANTNSGQSIPTNTNQTSDSTPSSANLNTVNHTDTNTDSAFSSISNIVSTSATTILNQGKDKVHRSLEILKKERHITPALISFYEKGVAAIKSKTSNASDGTATATDAANNSMARDDYSRKDNLNLNTANPITTPEKTEPFKFHPASTETSTASQPSIGEINQTASSASKLESVASIPKHDIGAVEQKPETITKVDFQEKESPIPLSSPSTEKTDNVTVQDITNQASTATTQPLPTDEQTQFKTTHPDSVQDVLTTENTSNPATITADETPQKPADKSTFRILIPLLLLLSALFAIWRLGLFNEKGFNFNDKDAVVQQPVATELQHNNSVTNPELIEQTVVVEPVRQIATNPLNKESSSPQVDAKTSNQVVSVKPSDITTEPSKSIQTEKVAIPQQEVLTQSPLVSETQPLTDLAPPIARLQSFIQSTNQLPAVFTLYGLRFEQGSSQYRSTSANIITDLAAVLKANPSVQIRLESHTDTRGKAETNMELTEARANEVKSQLVNLSVDPARIIALGMGEEKPIDGNFEEAWRSRNRRVNVVVTAR